MVIRLISKIRCLNYELYELYEFFYAVLRMVIRLISKIRSFKIYHCIVSLSTESSAGPVEVAWVERFGAELVSTAVWVVWVVGVNDISYARSEDVLCLESREPHLGADKNLFLHFNCLCLGDFYLLSPSARRFSSAAEGKAKSFKSTQITQNNERFEII